MCPGAHNRSIGDTTSLSRPTPASHPTSNFRAQIATNLRSTTSVCQAPPIP